jgi:dihydrolipoamide dehydrogenase
MTSHVPGDEDGLRFVVVGGGPAGHSAATAASILGARVTLIEDQVVGGAAHLWDCIPSKAMVSSSMRLHAIRSAERLGLAAPPELAPDMERLSARLHSLSDSVGAGTRDLLDSQGVAIIEGRARFTGPNRAVAVAADGTEKAIDFDVALVSTGSSPRVPGWAAVDGERVITTRHAYHLDALPAHVVIIGAGVTGVEFVHIFSSLGSQVTLIVSRHQVLPHRDAEVAIVLEEDFLERGVKLLKGARAGAISRDGALVVVETDDGRRVEGSHALLAVGSVPNTADIGLDAAGVATDHGFVVVDEFLRSSVPHIYAAGDVTGQMPLSSVAAMQGRKAAQHGLGHKVVPTNYGKMAQAIFTEPEIASVGLEEVDAAAEGRKVRITKVPFAANPRALIQGNPNGFAKVISDPATHEVLGGTIVGHHASELIAILAVAVQGRLTVHNLVDTLMVYPSLAESLMEAAD